MKNVVSFLFVFLFAGMSVFAQVGINVDNSAPDQSAMLDVKSNTKGVLLPRMTYDQRKAIVNPVEGLMVFCTNCTSNGQAVLSMFQEGKWQNIQSSCASPLTPVANVQVATPTEITWSWTAVPIADGYKGNSTNIYSTAVDFGPLTSFTEGGLTCWRSYTRYFWAYNSCGHSDALTITQSTLSVQISPGPSVGINLASPCQIIWNWNPAAGATGYKWNTIDDYATGEDMGTGTTKTEARVGGNNLYKRYVWAYNACGTSATTMLTCLSLPDFCVGQEYGGGIIFYIDGTGQHGLIAATSDQSILEPWGCAGTTIGGTYPAIGSGQSNTTAIVNNCSETVTAARLCNDLVWNSYSDWFLPSKDELDQMYLQRAFIGGFTGIYYWSSSEYNANLAWCQHMYTGSQSSPGKTESISVRAVRAF
ncbi:MAG: hypothetical protein WCK09_15180 [Bacteroidota bacterium]